MNFLKRNFFKTFTAKEKRWIKRKWLASCLTVGALYFRLQVFNSGLTYGDKANVSSIPWPGSADLDSV